MKQIPDSLASEFSNIEVRRQIIERFSDDSGFYVGTNAFGDKILLNVSQERASLSKPIRRTVGSALLTMMRMVSMPARPLKGAGNDKSCIFIHGVCNMNKLASKI